MPGRPPSPSQRPVHARTGRNLRRPAPIHAVDGTGAASLSWSVAVIRPVPRGRGPPWGSSQAPLGQSPSDRWFAKTLVVPAPWPSMPRARRWWDWTADRGSPHFRRYTAGEMQPLPARGGKAREAFACPALHSSLLSRAFAAALIGRENNPTSCFGAGGRVFGLAEPPAKSGRALRMIPSIAM